MCNYMIINVEIPLDPDFLSYDNSQIVLLSGIPNENV